MPTLRVYILSAYGYALLYMTPIHAIVLSVIEGITEFLPISSTGHMILASTLLRVAQSDFTKSFEIIIQLGAILAVTMLYWKKLLMDKAIFLRVIVAFIPTGIIGFILYKLIKTFLLGNPWIVVWSLALGGVLIILVERYFSKREHPGKNIEDLTLPQAAIIGLSQSLSVIPGISRAAATITAAMFTGMSREASIEFSFLLAIPTMAAATGLDLIKSSSNFTTEQYQLLGIGFLGAFITALVVVKWFLMYVRNHSFVPFGWYRIAIAILFVLFVLR